MKGLYLVAAVLLTGSPAVACPQHSAAVSAQRLVIPQALRVASAQDQALREQLQVHLPRPYPACHGWEPGWNPLVKDERCAAADAESARWLAAYQESMATRGHEATVMGILPRGATPAVPSDVSYEPMLGGGPVHVRAHTRCSVRSCWAVRSYTRRR
jgi:hypothetical protein